MVVLAKRPKIEYDQQSTPLTLNTNYLKIELMESIEEVYLIKIDFQPKIEEDNRILREKILNSCKNELKEYLGNRYLINIL